MARLARAVVPEVPVHLTHRGNRRGPLFFEEVDRDVYRGLLAEAADRAGLELWAYCLMTNHVHLLAMPRRRESLARAIGLAHRRFAQWQNTRRRWSGHLWTNRFFSTPLDEPHLWAAVRHVERNPVRAGLVARAEEWPWSSARAHVVGSADRLLAIDRPFPGEVGDWSDWLTAGEDAQQTERLRRMTRTGRPCGDAAFGARLSAVLGRSLAPRRAGRKPKVRDEGQVDLFSRGGGNE